MTDEDTPPPVERRAAPVPLPPKTTEQEDITAASQRRVSLIWEYTQAIIAISVVMTNMVVGLTRAEHPLTLSNTLFLVVGFYFGRTNHEKIGGVKSQPYIGR